MNRVFVLLLLLSLDSLVFLSSELAAGMNSGDRLSMEYPRLCNRSIKLDVNSSKPLVSF